MKKLTIRVLSRVFLFGSIIFGTIVPSVGLFAAEVSAIPKKPTPARLVNDFAVVFTPTQNAELEHRLVAFSDSTSNQITIVSVPTLGGYDAAEFAYEIGESWGVGNKKHDNGVVLLIKPKNEDGRGQVFIAPGYGLEAVITDAACKRIIEDVMIPHLKQDDYYGATLKAVEVLEGLASGEISEADLEEDLTPFFIFLVILVLIFIIFVIMAAISQRKGGNDGFDGKNGNKGSGADPLLAWWMLSSASGSSRGGSSWGGSSGGGFGGFGGGSFGGGGAGGSW